MGKFKSLFGAQDMTVGNPSSVIMKFIVPLLIGNFAQQMYSTVDSVIVGRYVGDTAIAAVGAATPIVNLLLALFMGISTGAGIIVSQYYGAKNREKLSMTIGNVINLTFSSSLLVMVVGGIITLPLLKLLNTPESILMDSAWYLWITLLGFLGCAYYNMISGMLRGLGDSIMPLVYLLITCGLNIILDFIFVVNFGLGVPGVAWATIISQFVSATLCLMRLGKMNGVFDFNKKYLKLNKDISLSVLKIGMPSGLTQAIFACASIVVQSLTNSFGTDVIATSVIVMRVDGFAMLPNFTFATAMATYVGQNIGAGNGKRVGESAKVGVKLGLMVSIPLVIALVLLCENIIGIFTTSQTVIDLGSRMLRMMSVGYIAVSINQVLMGVMRGAGDTMTPMISSIISTVLLRIPVAYGIAYFTRSETLPNGSPESIFYSLMISWVCGALITFIFYKMGAWKKKAKALGIGNLDESF